MMNNVSCGRPSPSNPLSLTRERGSRPFNSFKR